MNVTLHPDAAKFLEEQLKAGNFETADDVISAALLALQLQQQTPIEVDDDLRAAIKVGIEQCDRGETEDWDIEELRAEGRRQLAEAQRKKAEAQVNKKAV